jgi:serine/threonine-protein kinase RsbW
VQVHAQLSLPRDARYVGLLRAVAQSVLADLDAPLDASQDIQLALTEACGNVIRHATETAEYRVMLHVREDGCEVEVADSGPGFDPPDLSSPPVAIDLESGRGVQLMNALVDDLEFHCDGDATRVRLVKHWAQPRTPRGGESVTISLEAR